MPQNDLGIYSDKPFLYKFLEIIDQVIYFLFLKPISYRLSDALWAILIVLITGSEMALSGGSVLFGIILIVLLCFICIVWGRVLMNLMVHLMAVLFGKPVFGELGGIDRVTFFTSMKCSKAIQFDFNETDTALIKEFNDFDIKITREILKQNYISNVYYKKHNDDSELESGWEEAWNQITNVATQGIKYKDLIDENNFSLRVIPLKLTALMYLIGPILKFSQLIVIGLVVLYLFNYVSLLFVIQAGLILSFMLSILLFIHNAYKLAEIPLLYNAELLPDQIKTKFSAEISALRDKSVTPKNITVKKTYISHIRDYISRLMLIISVNSILALALAGITLLFGWIWFKQIPADVLTWYKNFSLGVIIIQLGFIAGHYITFFILLHIKKILAPVLIGIVTIVLPIAAEYIFTGNIKLDETRNLVLTAIGGSGIVISTAITSIMRKKLEED